MGNTMAIVDDETPPTWFHQDDHIDRALIMATSPTPHEWSSKGNIGECASLVPLVDYLDIDCFHDVDHLMDSPHTMSSTCLDVPPIYDEYDDEHVELLSCDAMLHRISCENSIGHIMFDTPLNLSYAMSEISHMASLQTNHSNYAYAIKINLICTYGIYDKIMVIGFCFSSDDIAILPLQNLCNSSPMPCHENDSRSHDSIPCVHHMHTIHDNALDINTDASHTLSLHYAIHNNKPFMMDDMFLYHASHLFEHWIFCANQHKHVCIIMDDVYIYHTHTIFPLSLFCVGTHEHSSTSQSHELTK
jgi:hypothetical protein